MRSYLTSMILAAVLAACAAPGFAETSDGTLQSVTLFESGLAELERDTGGGQTVTLRVPMRDVDDILKSLRIFGAGVDHAEIVMAGSDPVGDAFSRLPFPPAAVTDMEALLRAVPGMRVSVNQTVTGVVVDTGEVCPDGEGCLTRLSILDDAGQITNVVMHEGSTLQLLDDSIVQSVVSGLAALRASADDTSRDVTLRLGGPDVSDARLRYVIAAPVWKTSYRALSSQGARIDLQGWAVVENATGEDWSDVKLTLSAGSPVTLQADLFRRDWRQRGSAAQPPVNVVTARPFAETASADMVVAPKAAPLSPIISGAVMNDSQIESRFALPATFDIAAGQILSFPFLTESIGAERLALWKGSYQGRTGNPDLVLQVENGLEARLPAGIITVSDAETGFIGDARMPIVAPGETTDITYGTDRHIEVSERLSQTDHQTSVTVAEGTLRISGEQRRKTEYVITVHSGDGGVLAIDHPRQTGWEPTGSVTGAASFAETADPSHSVPGWHRFTLDLATSGTPSKATLTVTDTRPTLEVTELSNLNRDAFLRWSGSVDTEEEKAFLDTAADLSEEISQQSGAVEEALTRLDQLKRDQARTRDNLSATEIGTPARAQFMETLLELETEIQKANAIIDAMVRLRTEAEEALNAHLSEGL